MKEIEWKEIEWKEIENALKYAQEFYISHRTHSANIEWALKHIEELNVLPKVNFEQHLNQNYATIAEQAKSIDRLQAITELAVKGLKEINDNEFVDVLGLRNTLSEIERLSHE